MTPWLNHAPVRGVGRGSKALLLTSGPFGDSMSAAARPKRWGVSRQAKGQQFDPTQVELFALLTGRGVLLRVPGVTWGGKRKNEMMSMNGLRLMDQNWSQPLTLKITLPTLPLRK
jgi:hypothetical protein